MSRFSVEYLFKLVDQFTPGAKALGQAAKSMAGNVQQAGSAANQMAAAGSKIGSSLNGQAAAANTAASAMRNYGAATAEAARKAAAMERLAGVGYTLNPKTGRMDPPAHWMGGGGGAKGGGALSSDRGAGALALGGFLSYFMGMGKTLFETNLNFEKEFNNARAVMAKSSPAEMMKMRQQVIDLSKNSVFKATEIMKAAGELGSAGYEANDVMKALPTALKMAQAGREPIDKMAEMMVSIRNQFGLADSETTNKHVADVLAETARQTLAKFSDMREAFKMAGPFAQLAGVDLETTSAIIGSLAQKGIKGSLAGTGLRRLETGFLKADKNSLKFFKDYGINPASVYDSNGKLRDFVGTIEQLEKRGVKAKDVMKAFGDRAGPILAALLETGSKEIRRLRDELHGSQGAIDKMAAEQMKGLPGAWARFTAAIETARLAIGDSGFSGDMENAISKATGWVSSFSAMPDGFKRAVGWAGLLAGALAGLAMPVALLGFALRTLGITGAVAGIAGFAASLWRAAGAVRILMGLTGIGAALFIGYEVVSNWDAIAGAAERLGSALKALTSGNIGPILDQIRGAAAWLGGVEPGKGTDWGLLGKAGSAAHGAWRWFAGDANAAEGRTAQTDMGGYSPSQIPQSVSVTTRIEPVNFNPATVTVNVTGQVNGPVSGSGSFDMQAQPSRGTSAAEAGSIGSPSP